jgi:hypothetical protein
VRPALWFTQAEAQFSLAGISNERTKFYHIIFQLDHKYAAEVEDIIASPPHQDPYTALKTELLNRLSPTREGRARQIITHEGMGDRKPSQFLRHLRSLALDLPGYFLRSIWCSRLPRHVQTALTGQPEIGLDAATCCADSIMDSISSPELASVDRPADNAALLHRIEELPRQMETLSAERDRRRSSSRDRRYNQRDRLSSSRNRHLNNNSPSRLDNATSSCLYHRRFGDREQNCTQPCSYRREQGKLTLQTSAVAHVCTTATSRLFVTDKSSKLLFLINTGSDLCVFPRKLIPQQRERVNYDLCAANGTPIPTSGRLSLSLNLGLRREFAWRFVVANVAQPLIGADFLPHYGLLVDCRYNRLLVGVTLLPVPAQLFSCLVFSKIDLVKKHKTKFPSIQPIYRRPLLPFPLAYSSSLPCPSAYEPLKPSIASWTTSCVNSTSVSPPWTASSYSPIHSRSMSNTYGRSSTSFSNTGS